MSTKIGMMITTNTRQVYQSSQAPSPSNRMVMAIQSNNLRVTQK